MSSQSFNLLRYTRSLALIIGARREKAAVTVAAIDVSVIGRSRLLPTEHSLFNVASFHKRIGPSDGSDSRCHIGVDLEGC